MSLHLVEKEHLTSHLVSLTSLLPVPNDYVSPMSHAAAKAVLQKGRFAQIDVLGEYEHIQAGTAFTGTWRRQAVT